MAPLAQTLRSFDFYKKVHSDFQVGTLHGSAVSLIALVTMVTLFVLEFNSYLTVETTSNIILDEYKTAENEMLRINFNVTIDELPCHMASVEVEDVTGTKKHNVTRNLTKIRVDSKKRKIGIAPAVDYHPQYDELDENVEEEDDVNKPLDIGDEVVVKEGIQPKLGWRGVSAGSVGIIKKMVAGEFPGCSEPPCVEVDFPEIRTDNWLASLSELEHPGGFHKKETIEFHPWKGALKSGDDLHEGMYTFVGATDWCSQSDDCHGFTFESTEQQPERETKIWFKSTTHLNSNSKGWHAFVKENTDAISEDLSEDNFEPFLEDHHLVIVDFYAPWCIWCQRLTPTWERATKFLPTQHYNHKVRMGHVDCVREANLCMKMGIRAYPTIHVFRDADEHPVETYHGDRTEPAILAFIKAIVNGEAPRRDTQRSSDMRKKMLKDGDNKKIASGELTAPQAGTETYVDAEGCTIVGHLLVKKVPGNFHIHLHPKGYSVDRSLINATHSIGYLWFGQPKDERQFVSASLGDPSSGRPLDASFYTSESQGATYIHYIELVTNVIQGAQDDDLRAFRFVSHSGEYSEQSDEIPSVMFKYEMSPMAVLVTQQRKPFYHFITNVCAIIGGVFTVLGLMDSVLYATSQALSKKTL